MEGESGEQVGGGRFIEILNAVAVTETKSKKTISVNFLMLQLVVTTNFKCNKICITILYHLLHKSCINEVHRKFKKKQYSRIPNL